MSIASGVETGLITPCPTYSPRGGFVGGLYGIPDILPVSFTDVSDHFAIRGQNWTRVIIVRTLLRSAVIEFICMIDAVKKSNGN